MHPLAKTLGVIALVGSACLFLVELLTVLRQFASPPAADDTSTGGYVLGHLFALALSALLAFWLGRWGWRRLRS